MDKRGVNCELGKYDQQYWLFIVFVELPLARPAPAETQRQNRNSPQSLSSHQNLHHPHHNRRCSLYYSHHSHHHSLSQFSKEFHKDLCHHVVITESISILITQHLIVISVFLGHSHHGTDQLSSDNFVSIVFSIQYHTPICNLAII